MCVNGGDTGHPGGIETNTDLSGLNTGETERRGRGKRRKRSV